MSKPSNLAASLLAASAPKGGNGEQGERRYLSSAVPNDDMSKRDRDYLAASVEVVILMLGEAIRGAATALVSPLPARAKVTDVDPARVTLKTDGTKVSANLPVAYSVGDQTRYLNFTVTVPSGEVSSYLMPFCQRVSK